MTGKKLFGTDGIRGEVGNYPLDDRSVYRIGCSIGKFLGRGSTVLMGTDTRESCDHIADHLASGINAEGCEVRNAGVIPTPAISLLCARLPDIDGGLVISASHNPFSDNGIKLFSRDGTKLSEKDEEAIETLFYSLKDTQIPHDTDGSMPLQEPDYQTRYIHYLLDSLPDPGIFRGIKLVIDSAHGSTTQVVKDIFTRLEAEINHIGSNPNGININDGVGSQYPEHCRSEVLKDNCYAGLCFDGDGDRIVLVTQNGKILTGDHILLALAEDLHNRKQLPGNAVVATVMSNMGLRKSLEEKSIGLIQCSVGDRNVWQAMMDRDLWLGGEQSGHIINRHFFTSGDGLFNALHVLSLGLKSGKPLSELATMTDYPQIISSISVREKIPLEEDPDYTHLAQKMESMLGDHGRILVRYSGTEKKVRVMVEGIKQDIITEVSETLIDYFRKKNPPESLI